MSDEPVLDIAQADDWAGFRPGMMRAEVLEQLQDRGIRETKHRDGNYSATVDDRNIDFWYATDGSERLRQLALEGGICWNGKPVVDVALDDLLRALEPLGQGPMWEANDATDDPFPEDGAIPDGPVSDAELLEDSTVWLPDRQLGFVIWQGKVLDVVWRAPQDMPVRYAGPVTAAQRQLSIQLDAGEEVAEATPAGTTTKLRDTSASWQKGLTWICLALLAIVGREGFQEMRRWGNAETLNGEFVSLEQVPRKKYLDLGPEWVRQWMPDDPTRKRDFYRVKYLDPTGRPQTARLEAAELYVPPREPGEAVPFAYIPGEPPRVKGLSHAHDAAFLEYLPWAMAVGVLYVIGLSVIGFLPRWFRLLGKAVAPQRGGVDPDRPEMR